MPGKNWLLYTVITTVSWGIWGAFIEIPERAGFPATAGYAVWSLTMIPCALVALKIAGWRLEHDMRSILLGSAAGLLGGVGQLLLFLALNDGPAYIVFPLISLFPVLTIFLSITFLKETATRKHWAGITVSLTAILLLSYQPPAGGAIRGYTWLILSILVFILWGLQGYIMKFANKTMKAESIFFYMMATAVALIPVALWMTDFSRPINWSFKGPWLAALIHVLNSVGALTLLYALRYGKAIVVVPMTGLSPMITVILSLVIYAVVPGPVLIIGIVLALTGIFLLSD
jgi:uncharacterized membrane protein